MLYTSQLWSRFKVSTRDMLKMSLRKRNEELTHWISMSFVRLSSLSKSSLFITLPPELVFQPFVFQLSTQLVIPVQREYHHKNAIKEASKDQVAANNLLTSYYLFFVLLHVQILRQKHWRQKIILFWFSASVFHDCIFSLLPKLPNHVFPQQVFNLKTAILYMHCIQIISWASINWS